MNSNKTIENLILKGKTASSGYKSLVKQPVLPSSLPAGLNAASLNNTLNSSLNSNLAAALLPATTGEPKLSSLLGGGNLLATLNNLDSFKHLFGQATDSSKEPSRHGTPIGNSNLFSSLLNGALNQGGHSFNQQTNQLNNQLNCQLNGPMPDQLNILNSITNGLNSSSSASLPLTPTDSPTCSSSPSLPWIASLKAGGRKSKPMDLPAKGDSIKSLKDDLQNLTGSLLMANNLMPQICPSANNGADATNLQQQLNSLNNFLMATTAAQLLSLKYK